MKYLIDTNVLSEALRPRPHANVERWFESMEDESLYLSVISIGEIRKGVAQLDKGKRRARLEQWLSQELLEEYAGRIHDIDLAVALCWGDLVAQLRVAGRPVDVMDTFLAATAVVHDCILVTRNVRDFAHMNIRLQNPWD